MRKANYNDKDRVVQILSESFDNNPHFNYIIKNDKRRKKRITRLARYAFEYGIQRNGIYISENGYGVAIIFNSDKLKNTLRDYWFQLVLVLKVFGITRSLKVHKLETTIKRIRPTSKQFLYFWFLGVANKGRGSNAARELQQFIFDLSYRKNLPILLETTTMRNKLIYNRYGIKDYYLYTENNGELNVWFLYRNPA
ncbi:MAG: hypothetical protein MI922_28540 [Bacteroidales bacterium]|nr:hypothetical protein [Bacteroidales bacterium]